MNSVDFVKKICSDRGIALSRLEKDCGFGNGYISQLRKGVFPADRLQKIANYLNLSTSYISSCGEENNTFTIDLDNLDGERRKFAESVISLYTSGNCSDDETFHLVYQSVVSNLELIQRIIKDGK
uniref:Repressor protein n=1 Tax=Myoviridae sp. ctk6V34 TaxID=2825164 RepID=A0A8S5V3L4_9CAUD|nr:MAG TPA: repressor protein [Myoviridae sp. ctk6V34]